MKKIKIILLVIVLMACALGFAGLKIFKDKTTSKVETYLLEKKGITIMIYIKFILKLVKLLW